MIRGPSFRDTRVGLCSLYTAIVEHVRSYFTIRVRLLLPEGGYQFVKPNGGFWVPRASGMARCATRTR